MRFGLHGALLAATLGCVAAATTATAQDKRVEIGADAGWTYSDGVTFDGVVAGNGNLYNSIEPKDSFSWGAHIGFLLNPNLEIGALFSQQQSKLLVGGTTELEIGDLKVDNYHGYVAYNFGSSDAKVRPYVLGGAGATHYGGTPFQVGQVTGTTQGSSLFSTTWGAGFKIHATPGVALKIGARWTPTYIKSDAEGWWCDPYWGCYVVGDAQYSNQFEFSGGLAFRF